MKGYCTLFLDKLDDMEVGESFETEAGSQLFKDNIYGALVSLYRKKRKKSNGRLFMSRQLKQLGIRIIYRVA